MATQRSTLATEELYLDRSKGAYFITVDCVGVTWFASREEASENGYDTLYASVTELED